MWEYRNPDELYHYGILGMHWGHRKSKNGIISKIKNNYKEYKEVTKKNKISNGLIKTGAGIMFGSGFMYGFALGYKSDKLKGIEKTNNVLSKIGNSFIAVGTAKNLFDYTKYKINKKDNKDNKNNKKWSTKKKIVVTGAIAAGAVLGGIGAKKISSYVKSKNREIATINGWKEYFKNINKGKSFKESISKYYDITNKANNDNFRTSLKNVIK